MDLALYHPVHGFYMKNQIVFGKAGHFVTGPCLQGEVLAKTILERSNFIVNDLKNIVEWGAGSAELPLAFLSFFKSENIAFERYIIIETSPFLRKLQQTKIKQKHPEWIEEKKILWFSHANDFLEEYPGGIEAVLVANEVIDALPCDRFLHSEKKFYICTVVEKSGHLDWGLRLASTPVQAQLSRFDYPEGYLSEIHPHLEPWLKSVDKIWKKGLFFIADYGYSETEFYHPSRCHGTLLSYYQNTAHTQVLLRPGDQDITSHVNFSEVFKKAANLNWRLLSHETQSQFVLSSLDSSALDSCPDPRLFKMLVFPSQLGDAIKVALFQKGF